MWNGSGHLRLVESVFETSDRAFGYIFDFERVACFPDDGIELDPTGNFLAEIHLPCVLAGLLQSYWLKRFGDPVNWPYVGGEFAVWSI